MLVLYILRLHIIRMHEKYNYLFLIYMVIAANTNKTLAITLATYKVQWNMMIFKSRLIWTCHRAHSLACARWILVLILVMVVKEGGGLERHSCGLLCPETRCPRSSDLVLTQVICSFIKSKSRPHAPPGGPGGKLIGLFESVILFSAAIKVWSKQDYRPKQLCRTGCKDGQSVLTWAWFQSQFDHLILRYWHVRYTCYDLFYCGIVLFAVHGLMMKIHCLCWAGLFSCLSPYVSPDSCWWFVQGVVLLSERRKLKQKYFKIRHWVSIP